MSRKSKINDPVFYTLANNIAKILKDNNLGKKISKRDFTKQQKEQVERMMELEQIFRQTICLYKQSDRIYQKFLIYIKIEKGNILSARPYFRENSKNFGLHISPAFKIDDTDSIKNFHINYKFMVFVLKNWRGALPKKAQEAWEEHQQVRLRIIENSMPLAINEAMKFFKATPRSHVTLLDIINASISGLAAGVDKWAGPFSTVFRSVCIGRMKSNIMDIYNQTFLHYYPSDKKIIYKANLLKSRQGIQDPKLLTTLINEYLKDGGDQRELTQSELEQLLNGASMVSVEFDSDDSEGNIYDTYVDETSYLEENAERTDTLTKVFAACETLTIIEKKIIKLKGVDL
jgi:hypothetical protein